MSPEETGLSLKEYAEVRFDMLDKDIERRFEWLNRLLDERAARQERAVSIAFDSANREMEETKNTLDGLRSVFDKMLDDKITVLKSDLEQRVQSLGDKTDALSEALERRVNANEGRLDRRTGEITGAHDVKAERRSGQQDTRATWALVVSAITALLALAVFLTR